ncbi:MAG TPA: T9SS type A sorting domain-containing protein, partial [Chitinophagaceae bacterium]|nr:T9SS type A sorting domain-containing protein [Chitinophagaceae bacterium]
GGKQFNNFQSWTSSILVLPDGKISVAGGTQHNFLITRLNNDGSFDTSFNGNGKLSLHLGPVGSYDNASAIALQGNQMIVGGSSNYSTSNTHSLTQLVVRLPDTVKGLSVVITPRGTLTPCDGGSTKLAVNETGTVQWYNQGTPITGATDTVYIAYTSGSYSVTVQNDRGCGESDYLDVVFDGLPVTITPSGSLIFCQGDSVILTANESGNLQWYKDNIIVPGATNTAYTAKTPGSYFLYVQNANGCGESSPLDVVVDPDRPPISWDGTKLITTSSNYSYQWYFNGHSITGATGFSFKPAELGTYKVVIADYKCNNASEDFNIDCNVVAVPQPSITWTGTTLVTATGFDNYEWYVNGDSIPGAHTALLAPAQLGAYRVRVTGNFGCQNTSEAFDVNCTLAGPPKPPNIWDGTKFSTTSGYAHYQWYQDDTAILDATANTYTPAATQFGFFKVVVTDNNNCTNTSEKQPHFVTSVSDISVGGARLRFYPNPAQSVVNVEIANNPRTKLESQLYDLTGRLLKRKLLNQIQNQLRVDELPTGLYQLVIYNGTEKFAAKIAVIK